MNTEETKMNEYGIDLKVLARQIVGGVQSAKSTESAIAITLEALQNLLDEVDPIDGDMS